MSVELLDQLVRENDIARASLKAMGEAIVLWNQKVERLEADLLDARNQIEALTIERDNARSEVARRSFSEA